MSDVITLYDIASKEPKTCWSPNVWKSRLTLNFKKVPYKTEWLEYPDIKPRMMALGIKANEQPPHYTCPAIVLPDGTIIHDSKNIAEYLEKTYPTPSLHLEDPMFERVQAAASGLWTLLIGGVVTRVVDREDVNSEGVLSKVSEDYFVETRKAWFGCTLGELEKKSVTEEEWKKAEAAMVEFKGLLEENEGPFFMGKHPSYADFAVHGLFIWTKLANPKMFDRLMEAGGKEVKEQWEACEPFAERND